MYFCLNFIVRIQIVCHFLCSTNENIFFSFFIKLLQFKMKTNQAKKEQSNMFLIEYNGIEDRQFGNIV